MDEMKIKLNNTFTKKIISKFICKMLEQKLGYKIWISLDEIDVTIDERTTIAHLNVTAKMDTDDIKKLAEKTIDIMK